MKKMMKQTIAVVLSFVMAFGAIAVTGADFGASAAESGVCGKDAEWNFDASSGTLSIEGEGEMNDYLVSQTPWYGFVDKISSLTVGKDISKVGNNAFYGCKNLSSVELPEGLAVLGTGSFRECTSLENINIPASVTMIGVQAFYASGLKNVSVPAAVTSIGNNAFGWCSALEKISVAADNSSYCSDENGVLFSKDKTELIKFPCANEAENYAVPDSTKTIAPYAFENCYSLDTVTVSANVSAIGEGAFFNSYLSRITVNSANTHYTSDGNGVLFNNEKTLLIQYPLNSDATSYVIPEGVTEIASGAFHNSLNLQNVSVPDSMESLGDYVFLFCSGLEFVHIPSSVTQIGEEVIDYTTAYICSDTENCYAKEYAESNGYDFKVCTEHESGTKVVASGKCGEYLTWTLYDNGELVISGTGEMDEFENGVAPWSDYASDIEKLAVENGVKNIADNAFANCKNLAEAEIGDTVEAIGESSFSGCSSLEEFVVPEGLKAFGVNAFDGCDSLGKVVFEGTMTEWCALDFGNEFANPAYFADELYIDGNLVEDAVIPDTVSAVCNYAFAGYEGLVSASLPEGLRSIGDGAFLGTEIENITVPNRTGKIGGRAFENCSSLEYAHIPASVTEIGEKLIDGTDAYICSDTANYYPKEYADANGYEFSLCINHEAVGIIISETEIEVVNKKTYQLSASVNPATAPETKIVWTSDNTAVAAVTGNGLVIAASIGEANVTASSEDGSLYAVCKVTVVPRTYKITWIVDEKENEQSVNETAEIVLPAEPEKYGYDFTGWTPQIPDVMPSENLEFTATWSAKICDAEFDANGGVWADGSVKKTVAVAFDAEITAPEAPSRAGYKFGYWEPEVDVMNNAEGIEFKAVWIALTDTAYTVETYTMGTDGEYEISRKSFAGETDSTVYASYTVEKGFVLNEEKSVLSGVITADGALVLKICFDRVISEIKINGTTVNALYGSSVEEPSKPEAPEGYYHTGWVDENGEKISFPLVVDDDFPAEIKPSFAKLSYTVKWIVDGAVTEETYEYEQSVSTPVSPSKKGYTFKGWTPAVPDKMPAYDMEFTAVFEKITYTCDCGEQFDDEGAYNAHVAYEQAKKSVRVSILRNPGSATIKYGETLKLTAEMTSRVEGVSIHWFVDGEKRGDGETFEIKIESGSRTVAVKLVDSEGNVLRDASGNEISDSQQVNVKSGFFQKIISFFKDLFGMNRTVVQFIAKSTM